MGETISSHHKYQAFISYAHSDEASAARLQRALEGYPVPKTLRHKELRRISPIFRDVTELTAHHSLSTKIEDAVRHSRVLIVLCSPAAQESKWVNEEIRLFQKLHGDARIFCALIDGTPKTSFPPALIELGREPLAANLGSKHFRLGTMQLAASIWEVGLDDLAQRETKRRRRQLYAVTTASLLFSGVMAAASWNAVSARNDAQKSRHAAEDSRDKAETLIEFMLSDLTDALQPIGKLGIIDNVGDEVIAYYDAIPVSEMNDAQLVRRAGAMQILGQVAIAQGRADEALPGLHQARVITEELITRAPDDNIALYTHSQTEYSLLRAYENQNPELAAEYGISYKSISKRLYQSDTTNLKYQLEYGYACNKLGQVYQTLKALQKAKAQFSEAIDIYSNALRGSPENNKIKSELIAFERNLALIEYEFGNYQTAVKGLASQSRELEALLLEDPNNFDYRDSLYLTNYWIQNIEISNLNICKPDQIYALTSQMQDFINHDPSNEYYKSDFIKFAYTSIRNCPAIFDDNWLSHTISMSSAIHNLLSQKDDSLTEKNTWLGQYLSR